MRTDERDRESVFAKHAPSGAIVHPNRFNPDAYDCTATGARVPSCLNPDALHGSYHLAEREVDWKFRLQRLRDTINEIVAHQHEAIAVPSAFSTTIATGT